MAKGDEKHAAAPTGEDKVSIGRDELATIVATAVTAALAAVGKQDESVDKQIGKARERAAEAGAEYETKHRREHRRSIASGATFVAVIAPSTTFPAGRVIRLEDYEHPASAFEHEPAGDIPHGLELSQSKQWRYDRYWKHDLTSLVGKDAGWLHRQTDPVAAAALPASEAASV